MQAYSEFSVMYNRQYLPTAAPLNVAHKEKSVLWKHVLQSANTAKSRNADLNTT